MSWFKRLLFGKSSKSIAKKVNDNAERKAATYFWVSGTGDWYELPTVSSTMQTLLEASAKAYACIVANSEAAASLPWVVQRATTNEQGQTVWVNDNAHELNQLLANPMDASPSERPRHDMQALIELACLHLYLNGNAYWYAPRYTDGRPMKLLPMIADRVTTQKTNGNVQSYEYGGQSYSPAEVVHVWNTNPSDLVAGQSPTKAALSAISTETTAQQRVDADLKNQVKPGLIVTFEKGIREEQVTKFRTYLLNNYEDIAQTGRPLVIGGGVTVTPSPAKTLDYSSIRNQATSDIVAVYGTPPPIIGDMQAATLQNFATAVLIWWNNKLFPLLGTIANAINTQLIDTSPYAGKYRLWYDIAGTEVGLAVMGAKIEVAQGLVNLGYPPNMAAAKVSLGMPFVEALDVPMQQMTLAGRETTEPT